MSQLEDLYHGYYAAHNFIFNVHESILSKKNRCKKLKCHLLDKDEESVFKRLQAGRDAN